MSKEIRNIEKVVDKTYLITTYEKPLREQIKQKDQQISDLQAKIKELEETIKKLCSGKIFYDYVKELQIDNRQKEQQLRDLPKNIVDEVKNTIWTDQQDDGYLDKQVDIYYLTETLDTILKKYEE